MTLGDLIKKYRKEHSMSQQSFADLTGLSKAYISILERNFNPVNKKQPIPSVATIKSVAIAMNTDFNDLIAILDPDTQVSINAEEHPQPALPSDAIPYAPTGMVPVLGRIPAGMPVLAEEHIEGYEPVDVSDPENYYWLRVEGDSMINAGIQSGDLVLMRAQNYAENGQIVACRVNGDEATLKRFREQGDSIILLPENPAYEPRIVSKKDFADGYAGIVGVAIEIKRKL